MVVERRRLLPQRSLGFAECLAAVARRSQADADHPFHWRPRPLAVDLANRRSGVRAGRRALSAAGGRERAGADRGEHRSHRLRGRACEQDYPYRRLHPVAKRQGHRAGHTRRCFRRLDERQICQAHHPHARRGAHTDVLGRRAPSGLCRGARRTLERLRDAHRRSRRKDLLRGDGDRREAVEGGR